ncbi:MAG: TIGR04053 family radical SAM/SPASM domain-containing protein [Vicinamibacteria bacterium]|nr:TIGR04053 family radical SAM/SPASM domain-containing protein [Vicinamibacteria bacterium]
MTAVIGRAASEGDPRAMAVDFERAPFLVIWEVTRACALACVHCRADAIARRDPRELTTEEGFRLIDQVRSFGTPPPLLVLTGGDPMWRRDLAELVRYGTAAGLSVALTPSGTAMPTRKRLAELKDAGLARVAVSLDGPDPETHDAFRRVRGSYANTVKIIEAVAELGLPLQINTTVSRRTLPTLRAMAERVADFPLVLWAVFFLVPMGRGLSLEQISAQECEQVLEFLDDLSYRVPFGIKTTEAPHFRRIQATRHDPSRGAGASRRPLRAPRAVNDGNGFVFVDHVGDVCPSGFLPMPRGNVRDGRLVATYRHDDVFRGLRDADALGGRCGRCEFRAVCGGSRSRAFAKTGDAFAEDPLCAYQPAAARPVAALPLVQGIAP